MTTTPSQSQLGPRLSWRRAIAIVLGVLLLLGVLFLWVNLARTEFPMKEVSAAVNDEYRRGPGTRCQTTPCTDVAKLPTFVSSAPIFGEVRLDPHGSGGKALVTYHFALDESKGSGVGYDTLYFDANSNLDLIDDKPLVATDRTPTTPSPGSGTVYFERVSIPWTFGEGVRPLTLEFAPRFVFNPAHKYFYLSMDYTSVRQGKIRIDGRSYQATLVRMGGPSGRYDSRETEVFAARPQRIVFFRKYHEIIDVVPPERTTFPLIQMLCFGNKWYRLSATPAGERLSVKRYDGDFGLLRVDSGGRDGEVTLAGLLESRDSICLVGPGETPFVVDLTKTAEIPVGDYAPGILFAIAVGPLHMNLTRNRNSDGVPNDLANHPPRRFIEIRKDKPFTFELPEKLEVLFVSPAKDRAFAPGETVTVKCGLIDSVHDLVVNHIDDTRRNVPRGGPVQIDLEAGVTIHDSSGNVVMEGTLPINRLLYQGFDWPIPDTFEAKDGREKFTITVVYDTLELYGKIQTSREIIVESKEVRLP